MAPEVFVDIFRQAKEKTSALQKMTTFTDTEKYIKQPVSQHFMLCIDSVVQKPSCAGDFKRRDHPKMFFFTPENVSRRELGKKLVAVGKAMQTGKEDGTYGITSDPEKYQEFIYGDDN